MLDLEPINARLAAATPGPWHVEPEDTACGSFVARMPGIYIEPEHQHLAPAGNDAALIANAPADIAALVAEVERLTKERDEAQSIATKWFGAGAGSSRWSDQTIDLWYAHQKVIKSWVALPGEGGAS